MENVCLAATKDKTEKHSKATHLTKIYCKCLKYVKLY